MSLTDSEAAQERCGNERVLRQLTGNFWWQIDLRTQQASIVGQQFAGRVGLFLRVDDFDSAYQRMVAAGVRFVSPPRDELYGRFAVFLDLEGNRWDLLGRDPRR